jgi:hypothetical protein
MRIDTHVHAFPSLGDRTAGLPAAATALLAGLPAPPEVLGKALDALTGSRLGVDTGRLAAFRRQTPGPVHQVAEFVMSLGMGPALLLAGTLDRLRASMQRAGVDRSVVIASAPLAPNDWLLRAAASDPSIVPVVHVPPVPSEAPAEAWRQAYEDLAERGARGFKLHPNLDGLTPEHPAVRASLACARAHGRFVILHTGRFTVPGYRDLRPVDPRDWADGLREFPDVRVCLAHMNRDAPEVVWPLMKELPGLYTDTSWQPADAIRRAVEAVGPERILLGSDWPLLHLDLQVEAAGELERGAGIGVAARIAGDSARAFLGE